MDDSGGKFEYTPSRPATPTSDTDGWQQLSFVTGASASLSILLLCLAVL